jgi:hypothetical protein
MMLNLAVATKKIIYCLSKYQPWYRLSLDKKPLDFSIKTKKLIETPIETKLFNFTEPLEKFTKRQAKQRKAYHIQHLLNSTPLFKTLILMPMTAVMHKRITSRNTTPAELVRKVIIRLGDPGKSYACTYFT